MKTHQTSKFNWYFPDSEEHFQTILAINPEYQIKVKLMALQHASRLDFSNTLDIGANVGLWTRWLVEQGAKTVTCFEPMVENLECLRENVKDLTNVIINPFALSDVAGDLHLYTTQTNSNTGTATIVHNHAYTVEYTVPCKRLDDLNLAPTFIKIDVQGAEIMVFKGGLETLAKHKPAILLEAEDEERASVVFLRTIGYNVVGQSNKDFLMMYSE